MTDEIPLSGNGYGLVPDVFALLPPYTRKSGNNPATRVTIWLLTFFAPYLKFLTPTI